MSKDKLISSYDTSAASRARELFERTGKQTSCYAVYPERETYSQGETYERADGSRYSRWRSVSRWGGSYSMGDWEPNKEISPATAAPVTESV